MSNVKLLFDTDVLIDYLRDQPKAVDYLENHKGANYFISVITVAELFAGSRESEKKILENFIDDVFEVIGLDRKIAELGGIFSQHYKKSHGVGLADALIAATAKLTQATLVTFNKKHFPMLNPIMVPYEKN